MDSIRVNDGLGRRQRALDALRLLLARDRFAAVLHVPQNTITILRISGSQYQRKVVTLPRTRPGDMSLGSPRFELALKGADSSLAQSSEPRQPIDDFSLNLLGQCCQNRCRPS